MNTMEDIIALQELLPRMPRERPVDWLSRARREGLITIEETHNIVRKFRYLFL